MTMTATHVLAAARGPMRRGGFSLLELMVVLAVLAVLAALVVPAVRPASPRLTLTGLAQEVIRAAAVCRAEAIRTGRITRVDIDLQERRLQASGLPDPIDLPGNISVTAQAVHQGAVGSTTARFLFYPDGQSSGGSITLGKAGMTIRVDINWVTGHAAARAS